MCLRNRILGFDLMETLVFPPKEKQIQGWLATREENERLSTFQKDLFCSGFPYASLVTTMQEAELTKNRMLTCERNWPSHREEWCINLAKAFVSFFIESCILPKENKNTLLSLRKLGYRLCVISNLYAVYIPLLERFSLNEMTDSILLSCNAHACKPSTILIDQAFSGYMWAGYIGDNYRSDICPLLGTKVTPFFLTQSRVLAYLRQHGIGSVIESECPGGVTINRSVFRYLVNVGLIVDHPEYVIPYNQIIFCSGRYFLTPLSIMNIINSVPQVMNYMR